MITFVRAPGCKVVNISYFWKPSIIPLPLSIQYHHGRHCLVWKKDPLSPSSPVDSEIPCSRLKCHFSTKNFGWLLRIKTSWSMIPQAWDITFTESLSKPTAICLEWATANWDWYCTASSRLFIPASPILFAIWHEQ